jgi:hypothetical protein
VARRSTTLVKPLGVSHVVLGERWGCAELASQDERIVECWDAPRKWTGHVQAWEVPWLRGKVLEAGPDRVCLEQTARCWRRPRRGESEGKELSGDEWLSVNPAQSSGSSRSELVEHVFSGGTFLCLQAAHGDGLWCLGDNRYGQHGGSSSVRPPNAAGDGPLFVRGTWPAYRVAAGTWHACAMAARDGSRDSGGPIMCWGRGDYGQLGARAPDRCKVDGASIACAKTAQPGVRYKTPLLSLLAGDLYTCISTPDDISCWGASRDGFFGTRAQCPASLRRAWPTLHGHVPAPRATCSLAPAKVSHIEGFQQMPSAGPRGICYDEDTPLRCVGGIRTPRGKDIHFVVVSPGEDASACGVQNEKAVCWGEGYSPPGAPNVPLTITLDIPPTVAEAAVVEREEAARYSAKCLVHRGCDVGPAPVPACPADIQATDWSALRGTAATHLGELVSVRGAVAVGPIPWALSACGARADGIGCCGWGNGPVVLGSAPALRLAGLSCAGDESLLCCNGPAYGETLIASGRLEKNDGGLPDSRLSDYKLVSPTLCKPN